MKKKIIVAGIGGVGGYYGGLLARKYEKDDNIDVYFVARGEHLNQIKKNGLKVITETGEFITRPTLATNDVSEIGKVDYIILCTKSYDLDTTIEQLKPSISEGTVILPLLNGADISERIRRLLPGIEVWEGCVYIVGRLNEPGVVESSGGLHDLFFGYANDPQGEKLLFLQKLMEDAGIIAHLSADIRKVIWRKFIFISTTASLTSYFNVGFRDLLTDDIRKDFTLNFVKEVSSVAQAEGVVFDFDIKDAIVKQIEKLPYGTTSSMHTDFQAGKNAELNTLTKIVVDFGQRYDIPTPYYQKVYDELSKR